MKHIHYATDQGNLRPQTLTQDSYANRHLVKAVALPIPVARHSFSPHKFFRQHDGFACCTSSMHADYINGIASC